MPHVVSEIVLRKTLRMFDLCVCFETGSHYVDQVDLGLTISIKFSQSVILLPSSLKCQGCRCETHLSLNVFVVSIYSWLDL